LSILKLASFPIFYRLNRTSQNVITAKLSQHKSLMKLLFGCEKAQQSSVFAHNKTPLAVVLPFHLKIDYVALYVCKHVCVGVCLS